MPVKVFEESESGTVLRLVPDTDRRGAVELVEVDSVGNTIEGSRLLRIDDSGIQLYSFYDGNLPKDRCGRVKLRRDNPL